MNCRSSDFFEKYLKRDVILVNGSGYKINPNINIHVGIYQPLNLHEFNKNDQYLVFSGIGNHQTFIKMIEENGFNISKDIEFPDHYKYTEKDIKQILDQANSLNSKIITTEKDYLRLENKMTKGIKFIKSDVNGGYARETILAYVMQKIMDITLLF